MWLFKISDYLTVKTAGYLNSCLFTVPETAGTLLRVVETAD